MFIFSTDSSCWSEAEAHNQKLDLTEVASLNENQCKLRCMETWNCFHIAYNNDKCYIQFWNTAMIDDSITDSNKAIGTVYRAKDLCKSKAFRLT